MPSWLSSPPFLGAVLVTAAAIGVALVLNYRRNTEKEETPNDPEETSNHSEESPTKEEVDEQDGDVTPSRRVPRAVPVDEEKPKSKPKPSFGFRAGFLEGSKPKGPRGKGSSGHFNGGGPDPSLALSASSAPAKLAPKETPNQVNANAHPLISAEGTWATYYEKQGL